MRLRYPYEVRQADYFSDIRDVKIPAETLKLAEHILDTKSADLALDSSTAVFRQSLQDTCGEFGIRIG
jgi:non-homologous end joining protein Ku